jgi:hypothetical protein
MFTGWSQVIRRFSVMTFIVGALFIYGGAAGRWSIWQYTVPVDDTGWRVALAVIGAILLTAAVYIHLVESRPPPPKLPKIVEPAEFKGLYRVDILKPKTKDVQAPFVVSGTCDSLPPDGYSLWLFLLSLSNDEFYPHAALDLTYRSSRRGYTNGAQLSR